MNKESDKNQTEVMQENEESKNEKKGNEEAESTDESTSQTEEDTGKEKNIESEESADDQENDEEKAESSEEETEEEEELTEVEELQQEVKKLKDKYLRLYAEFENYKKRMMREKSNIRKLASKDTITQLLPVLDDFKRAKAVAEDESTDEVFTEGVELVYDKFKKVLQDCGLKEMESEGVEFDSELHEAFAELPVDEEEKKGKVIDTIETGYYLKDTIIRHAKVVVGK